MRDGAGTRKNYLFAGSDAGGERAAAIYSLLGSAKLNGIDPEAYLRLVLCRPHCGPAALETVSGQPAGVGGGMTPGSSQTKRAHNFRVLGAFRNETEIRKLHWQPLESKLLAAAAYLAPRRLLYRRFHSGDVYRYFTIPPGQYQDFLDADSQGRYFLAHIRNQFPYERLPR